jgi:hypothetical protein
MRGLLSKKRLKWIGIGIVLLVIALAFMLMRKPEPTQAKNNDPAPKWKPYDPIYLPTVH